MELASKLISTADDCYENVTRNLPMCLKEGLKEARDQECHYLNILCKYANFLYQTGRNLPKAAYILEFILCYIPDKSAEVVIQKEQFLSLDANLRPHLLEKTSSITFPTVAFTYYLLVMVYVCMRDRDGVDSILPLFSNFVFDDYHTGKHEWYPGTWYYHEPFTLLGHAYVAVGNFPQAKAAFEMQNTTHCMPTKANSDMIMFCDKHLGLNLFWDPTTT